MKHLIIKSFLSLLIVSNSFDLSAQEFFQNNSVRLSPFDLVGGQFELTYERYIKERYVSICIMPSLYFQSQGQESTLGYQAELQFRRYLSHFRSDEQKIIFGMHNVGFYGGAYLLGLNLEEDYLKGYYDPKINDYRTDLYTSKVGAAEGGVMLGVQVDITKFIVVDFYIGGGVRAADYETNEPTEVDPYFDENGIFDLDYQGIKPKIGFQMGIAF